MKLKRIIALALTALMLVSTFVSCNPEITETETETDKETETDTDKETETDEPDAAAGLESGDIVFMRIYGTGENNDTPVKYGFIELFNRTGEDIDISGMKLHYKTDTSSKYAVFTFPEGSVVKASSSYLIRCGEGKDKSGDPYDDQYEKIRIDYYDAKWDQVIDNKEVTLALTKKSGSVAVKDDVSKLDFVYAYYIGTQSANIGDYSAKDISKNIMAIYEGGVEYDTVNLKNASASTLADVRPLYSGGDKNTWLSQTANVVSFSHDAGFYDEGFDLKLEALDGYKIYYTTNGKDPRTSGTLYRGSIQIGKTDKQTWGSLTKLNNTLNGARLPSVTAQFGAKVIKAYATDGKTKTQVVTRSYFVIPGAEKYDVPFISISMTPSEFLSEDRGIYYTVMKHPFETKERRTAYLEIIETDGTCVSSSYVELSMNGNGSLGNAAKSMRLYFKADADPSVVGNPSKLRYDIFEGKARDGVTEYKRLILRNSGNDSSRSHIRDAYMQAMCSELSASTMAYRPSFVFINGEFWGLYNIRERYDAKYFNEHYGVLEENFCMLESPSPLITGNGTTMYWLNDGEEGDEQPFIDLYNYIMSHNMSDEASYKYVSDRLDFETLIDFFVGSMYMCNLDWPSNNIKVWRNKDPNDPSGLDTKWRFVFCDMDMGVGLASNIDNNMFPNAFDSGTIASNIMKRLLANDEFKHTFIDRFYEATEKYFNTERANAVLDEMAAGVRDIIIHHFNRWPSDGGSMASFESHIDSIRYFMNNRADKAIDHMQKYFGIMPSSLNASFDEKAVSLVVDGEQVTRSGYTKDIDEPVSMRITIEVEDGYEFLGAAAFTYNGMKTNYSSQNINVKVTGATTLVVYTRKAGMTVKPMVVTGSRSAFLVDKNGDLYAWGANDLAQLCVQSDKNFNAPKHVFSGVVKVATSMGGTEGDAPMTAILTSTGDVYTVGNNTNGQLGRKGSAYVLTRIPVDFKAVDISVGLDHLLVLAENGELYGCGNNSYGQLGNNNYTGNVMELTLIAKGVKSIAAGRRHTLYTLENDELYVLGDNRWQKFSGTQPEVLLEPYKIATDITFISTGQHNCLAIDKSGDLYYFGWRSVQNFGSGGSSGKLEKIAENIKEAYIQDEHIVMLSKSGEVYGFGLNTHGQISSDKATKNTPHLIASGARYCGAGTHYSLWITSSGQVYVIGTDGNIASSTSPKQIYRIDI